MTRYWFENINTNLKKKRSQEELLVAIKEWSTAKSRINEEIVNKNERNTLASNPARLAVLSKGSLA